MTGDTFDDAIGAESPPGPGVERDDDLYARERYVLYCLLRHGRMSLADVADEVTVWEAGAPLPELPASEPRTVYLSLYHTHVPRLRRRGLVGYAVERDLVWLTDEARDLDPAEPPRAATTSSTSSADP